MRIPLYRADEIRSRVFNLSVEIRKDYNDDAEIYFLAPFKGSVVFLSDLIRATELQCVIDFVRVGRYGGSGRGLIKYPELSVTGRHVLIVDVRVVTGRTLKCLYDAFWERQPLSLRTVTLVNTLHRREVPVPVDYTGFFTTSDGKMFGYGMDDGIGGSRHLPGIWSEVE